MTRTINLSLPGAGLVVAGGVLVAAKAWGGLPWPWWVVTLPLWLVAGFAALAMLVLVLFGVLAVAVFIWGR